MGIMISKQSCAHLDEQGYSFLSVEEKNKLNIALRVTPIVCITLVAVGLYYQSILIFFVLSIFGVLGSTTSQGQPIDVLYNLVARLAGWPQLPPSPLQKRFACGVGAFFLIGATVSLSLMNMFWAYMFGAAYVIAAGLMALTHFCIASWLYNRTFGVKS